MPTFTPIKEPTIQSNFSDGAKLYRAEFGDGREQVSAMGINNIVRTRTLVFDALTAAELQDLIDFFDDLYCVLSFDYQVPSDSISRTWRETEGQRSYSPSTAGLWSFRVGIKEVRI